MKRQALNLRSSTSACGFSRESRRKPGFLKSLSGGPQVLTDAWLGYTGLGAEYSPLPINTGSFWAETLGAETDASPSSA